MQTESSKSLFQKPTNKGIPSTRVGSKKSRNSRHEQQPKFEPDKEQI